LGALRPRQLYAQLTKAQSALAVQIRRENVGFRDFLYQRKARINGGTRDLHANDLNGLGLAITTMLMDQLHYTQFAVHFQLRYEYAVLQL